MSSDTTDYQVEKANQSMNDMLFHAVRAGQNLREMKKHGDLSATMEAANGDELAVHTYCQVSERFDVLRNQGLSLRAALDTLRREGWAQRVTDIFLKQAMGGSAHGQ